MATKQPCLRVAIIGGGPAAMFFCHAWNQQKKAASRDGKQAPPLAHELEITCLEREASPGGIWRSHTATVNNAAYEELWTNGPCHGLEFHDYTFDEHFQGTPVPVYLPRLDIHEYLMQRVTKDAPTFFQDYFQFQTKVLRVQEKKNPEEGRGNLEVTVQNVRTGEVSMQCFDRCIWAAGENSQGSIPESLRTLLTNNKRASLTVSTTATADEKKQDEDDVVDEPPNHQEAQPLLDHPKLRLFHSTETHKIRECISDQRVLLIGGGFSAEDLALQCLKWGAAHVDVAARDGESEVTWTSKWPGDRVEVHKERGIHSVEEDGTIHLESVEFVWPHSYRGLGEDNHDLVTLRNIDVVIFCTGYQANLSMLDESLRPQSGSIPQYYGTSHPSMSIRLEDFAWEDWKMNTNHPAFKYTGDVPVAQGRMVYANYNHPEMHRGILFRNPHMMFLCEHGSDAPLLSLDIQAWLLCSYLTGRIPMPSVPELQAASRQQVLDQLHLPAIRYLMDEEYSHVLDEAEPLDDDDDGYWPKSPDAENCGSWDAETQYTNYMFQWLARVMEEGQYPGKSFGTYEELNETGQKAVDFGLSSYYMRTDLEDYEGSDDDDDDGTEWRTFRDDVVEPKHIHSLYTGTKARPLKLRWMDAVGPSHSVKNGI